MSNGSLIDSAAGSAGVTISFGERFQASQQFDQVFREGMTLVEEAAAYLDSEGRAESKGLPPNISMLYATESMRLTTRLLDLASWLLIRRALKEGEISEDEARYKRRKVKLKGLGRPSHIKNFDELPEGLRRLIVSSFALHDRIVKLDKAMSEPAAVQSQGLGFDTPVAAEAEDDNPVAAQMTMLRRAFCN